MGTGNGKRYRPIQKVEILREHLELSTQNISYIDE